MSKMSPSNEKVENKEEKTTETTESEVKTKEKITLKNLFTKENLKKGSIWFFKSYIWLAILLFIGDMVTKVVAEKLLTKGDAVTVIPHLLNFTLTYNTGAAWGAGGDAMWSRILLCCVSWVAMVGIIWALCKYWKKLNGWYKASIMAVLAGDVGNLIDRTFFFNRGVIDFMDITPLIPGFGIFNFADSCLVVGIIILLILMLIDMFKDSKKNKVKAAEAEEKIKNEREK